MKKVLFIITSLFLASCSRELDTFNENPNSPTEVTPSLLLSNVEVGTFSIQTTGLARLSGIWSQQMCGTSAGQLGDYAVYNLPENAIGNEWSSLYTGVGVNAKEIINKYGSESPYYSGIAKVILAINMGYATDFWNEVPFSQAFKGKEGDYHPIYDKQEAIYKGLQSMLDEAIVELGRPESANKNLPGGDDLIYEGDVSKWIKAAYTLKARYALRLSEVTSGADAAQKALDYLNKGFSNQADDMNAVFKGGGSSQNQWYAFDKSRANYLKMGSYFVNLLKKNADPRLPFYASKDSKGGYSGNDANNLNDLETSSLGSYLSTIDKSVGIITYTELKFIEAEAHYRLGHTNEATSAFKEAVRSSLKLVTGSANDSYVNAVTGTVDLENILLQKYVALFGSMEPYNDYRRTGYPALTPLSGSAVPKRLPTPQNERLYNKNAVVVGNITDAVWWDKN
ncbi:SusD/RagB family nutrient-binding outer membrane lipoprotein [Riemerella anatipestifer]|uniref:SusD/RagB family nutrient-binding outer membrane lipoprotein n=1 Tax=Riemerella anatipestifer TaxID=34085 RepID=UPI002A8ACE02|nr:SusD/RagB family nutrient-binding outer membrane lipoprotein [Riemerella anatipestifer]